MPGCVEMYVVQKLRHNKKPNTVVFGSHWRLDGRNGDKEKLVLLLAGYSLKDKNRKRLLVVESSPSLS